MNCSAEMLINQSTYGRIGLRFSVNKKGPFRVLHPLCTDCEALPQFCFIQSFSNTQRTQQNKRRFRRQDGWIWRKGSTAQRKHLRESKSKRKKTTFPAEKIHQHIKAICRTTAYNSHLELRLIKYTMTKTGLSRVFAVVYNNSHSWQRTELQLIFHSSAKYVACNRKRSIHEL